MNAVWGMVLVALGGLAWGGQTLSAVLPDVAQRVGLMERPDAVDATYWADIRAEARWDALTLWVLIVAGVLLIADEPSWAYFGLVGSGAYLYFAGRGIMTRLLMRSEGRQIGTPGNVSSAMVFLAVWAVMALVTLIMAAGDLETP